MKKYIVLFAVLATALFAETPASKPADKPAAPAVVPAKEAPKPDPIADLTKERDELKAKVTAGEQTTAQLQAANQYLSVLAERNEMAVRLLQANARADDLQKQLDIERAKSGLLQQKIDELTPKPAEKK